MFDLFSFYFCDLTLKTIFKGDPFFGKQRVYVIHENIEFSVRSN